MIKTKFPDYSRIQTSKEIKIVRKCELAKMLGVSESTIYRMIRAKQLPAPMRTPQGYVSGWFLQTIEEWTLKQ